jgi:hypothetical protein
MKLIIIFIIYNKKIDFNGNFQLFEDIKNEKLYFYDNSEILSIKIHNKLNCRINGFSYVDMKGNKGLSKVYNQAIISIKEKDWLVIFDQDTEIPTNYLQLLKSSIELYPKISIHVPIVKSRNSIISPCLLKGHIIRKIKFIEPGIHSSLTAINSGMAIHARVFELVGNYNEQLFLDYVDHFFIRKFYTKFDNLAVFNSELKQDFSDEDHSNFAKDLKRFIIFKRDFYEFCKDSFFGYFYFYFKIFGRALKLSLIHRDFRFFKVFNRIYL